MTGSIRRVLRLAVANDPRLTSTVLGVLYVLGGLLTFASLLAPLPPEATRTGLAAAAGIALVIGTGSILWAGSARTWSLHLVLGAGTTLICMSVYFAGVASAIYPAMFLWVVLVAAHFFSARAVAGHLAWVLAAWGATLAAVGDPSGFSIASRWMIGGFVLIVAAVVLTEHVAGIRTVEEELRSEIKERARLQEELEHLADHDALTGLPNRRRFEHELARELARAEREETPLSIVALDLDRFKDYNDLHGHGAGDRLLKTSASTWAGALRSGDLIARVGGDEFVAVLPGVSTEEADRVVERLCSGFPAGISCSAGLACWDRSESADDLLHRADLAMYEAKVGEERDSPLQPTRRFA